MQGKTHALGGLLLAEAVLMALKRPEFGNGESIFLIAGAVGGLLPDIDHPYSKISKTNAMTQMISAGVGAVTKHRSLFLAGADILRYVCHGTVRRNDFPSYAGFAESHGNHVAVSVQKEKISYNENKDRKQQRRCIPLCRDGGPCRDVILHRQVLSNCR